MNVDQRVEENSEQSSIKFNFIHMLSELKMKFNVDQRSPKKLWIIMMKVRISRLSKTLWYEIQIIVVLSVAQGQNLTSRCLAPAFPGCLPLAGLARPGEHDWDGLTVMAVVLYHIDWPCHSCSFLFLFFKNTFCAPSEIVQTPQSKEWFLGLLYLFLWWNSSRKEIN